MIGGRSCPAPVDARQAQGCGQLDQVPVLAGVDRRLPVGPVRRARACRCTRCRTAFTTTASPAACASIMACSPFAADLEELAISRRASVRRGSPDRSRANLPADPYNDAAPRTPLGAPPGLPATSAVLDVAERVLRDHGGRERVEVRKVDRAPSTMTSGSRTSTMWAM